ncbi:MAG: zinc ABC transporter substrate-binding protein [Pseudomonadota bacterium]
MKKFLTFILVVFCFQNANAKDWATAQIFACEPEWGALAREIVGNKAKVVVAMNEFDNPHFVKIEPRIISDLRKADILFCSGANLEVKWLPDLLKKVSKPDIQIGGSGYFMASDYVRKLDVPQVQSDDVIKNNIHPFGNPHIHLNPNNIPPIATEFLKRILAIDSANAKFYQKNYDNFIKRWNLAIVRWEFQAQDLKNMPIIIEHDQWAYLADWLGLKVVAKLEEKPGTIPPSSQYLLKVLRQIKTNPADVVLYAPFEDKNSIFWFANRARIKAILLPYTVSSTDSQAQNLFGLFDETINSLVIQSQQKSKRIIDLTDQS